MKYIDTHAHLMSSFYEGDPLRAVKEAQAQGINKIILPGTTAEDSLLNIAFAQKNQGVYAMAGIHPADATSYHSAYLVNINPQNIVAVGEVGLDFYRASNPSAKIQIACFKAHIDFALKHQKPLVIHMRNSEQETYNILKKYKQKHRNLRFLLHSCTSSLEWVEKFLALDAYISFSGIVTFKNAPLVQAIAKIVPSNRLLTETDSPFLTPVPFRGKINAPAYVKQVTDFVANLRQEKNLGAQIYQNALDFFGL